MCAVINLGELPEDVQKELYDDLRAKFQGKSRAGRKMSQEEKVLRVSLILRTLEGCSIPQQRSILTYGIAVLNNASHRFWRDPHASEGKGGKGKK